MIQAETALVAAKRRLSEAKTLGSSGGIAQTLILDLSSEAGQDSAALQQARAQAALRQALVKRHTLKTPFAGVISRRMGEAGEWVSPGQGVYELVALDDLRLDFAVAEDFTPVLTVFGLAPLVLIPGAGTELYRGVGVIVMFGIIGAAIVTLTLLPALTTTVLQYTHRERKHVATSIS